MLGQAAHRGQWNGTPNRKLGSTIETAMWDCATSVLCTLVVYWLALSAEVSSVVLGPFRCSGWTIVKLGMDLQTQFACSSAELLYAVLGCQGYDC